MAGLRASLEQALSREEAALQVTGARGGAEEPKVFSFDHIFDQADAQADVYAALGPPVLQMLQRGHNASVFAYGQTGSGKTYTMLGTDEAAGLVPRLPAVAYLLQP